MASSNSASNVSTSLVNAAIEKHWQRNTGLFLAAQNFFLFGSSSVFLRFYGTLRSKRHLEHG